MKPHQVWSVLKRVTFNPFKLSPQKYFRNKCKGLRIFFRKSDLFICRLTDFLKQIILTQSIKIIRQEAKNKTKIKQVALVAHSMEISDDI